MLQIPHVPLSRSAAQKPERPPKNLPKIGSVIRTRVGGYHFSNGATAQYDPALGLHGGVRFNNGVTAEYEPFFRSERGYRYSTGTAVHHVLSQHGACQTVH